MKVPPPEAQLSATKYINRAITLVVLGAFLVIAGSLATGIQLANREMNRTSIQRLKIIIDQAYPFLLSDLLSTNPILLSHRLRLIKANNSDLDFDIGVFDSRTNTVFNEETQSTKDDNGFQLDENNRPSFKRDIISNGQMIGWIQASIPSSFKIPPESFIQLGLWVALLLIAFSVLVFTILQRFKGAFILPLSDLRNKTAHLNAFVLNKSRDNPFVFEKPFQIKEISSLGKTLENLAFEIRDGVAREQALKISVETQKQYALLARQVAHDIRSPIAALSLIHNNSKDLSTEDNQLLNGVINRVKEISNNLLSKTRLESTAPLTPLSQEFKQLKDEKNLEFSHLIESEKIKIIWQIDDQINSLTLSSSKAAELKSSLSNLINNSIEAIVDSESGVGTVTVKSCLFGDNPKSVLIEVIDDGPGIPPEILQILGSREVESNKVSGSGLGFYLCSEFVKRNGGFLETKSTTQGTQIRMRLPLES